MAKWTRNGHHQVGGAANQKVQFCEDGLNCFESDEIGGQHKAPDSAAHKDTSDFTQQEQETTQSLMSRKQMEAALEQILADVKSKRENDLKIVSDVKKEVMAQAARSCDMLEQYMNHMHQLKSKQLATQIVGLMDALSKSQKLESELDHSKTSLRLLCQDINSSAKFL